MINMHLSTNTTMMANTMVSDPYSQQYSEKFTGDSPYPTSTGTTTTRVMTKKRRSITQAIPINRESIMKKTESDYQIAQDEAEADVRDYLFFSRVVDGIARQNSLLKDDSYLKSTNETLLDNIVKSRQNIIQQQQQYEEDDQYAYYYHNNTTMATDLKIVSPATNHRNIIETDFSFSPEQDDYECNEHDCECSEHDDDDDEGVFDFEL
ncbi:hypothetical protein FRACYDRAFT_270711 [Fragilariopsis cylindrus CCMP1102]|uniref:Uncharacterized protein n=1 Tax=Fragilariopsis cylindrus CCMP1102 TaxID=635003 RepID=A0A1E7F1D1_9STRA|nr:hypothetical protein FRACYDRAFT_270711 [Fragilariopsis cylindrus CCMP1102]|eukprot:OEU11990.1 hypothetical protein FRACYDRAFT_270711 [Fragilariopsis cylindrus CCMP1102]